MPTIHQFIDSSHVLPTHQRAIFGTIHPPRIENFKIPYFYGNRGNLWDFLTKAFPCLNFDNRQEIIQTLAKYDVWISDIVRECDHKDGKASDDHLDNIIYNTEQIRLGLINSQIDTIYFTSEFTFTLFKRAFSIRLRFDRNTREMIIPTHYFGRQIKALVLYSPSDNACRGISRSQPYKEWCISGKSSSIDEFRIAYYKDKMAFWNCL